MTEKTINLRGLKCPLPALRARKALTGLKSGDMLIAECTDPLTAIDIPNLLTQMAQYSGTKTYGFPVTTSALIDDGGVLRGLRLVSDPRGDLQNRDEAYLLRNFLTARFGRDGWSCESLPPEEGETPVDGIFVKERCAKQIDAATSASLATRHLRKAGQSRLDPRTGRETTGQFESTVRFELVRK